MTWEEKHTRRKLRLPLALGLRDSIVGVVGHFTGGSKECAQERDVWHRTLDGYSLRAVVEGATESAGRVRAEEGACCIADGVEGADELWERREAHGMSVIPR